jgi:hypothetical protein
MHRIAIGIATGSFKVHLAQPISLIHMMGGRDWSAYHFEVIFQNGIYIEVNRNVIAATFLKRTDCDFLFFWDHDNGLFPDAFDLFMEDMKDPNINILSGLYYRKEPEMRSVAGMALYAEDGYTSDSLMFLSAGLIDLTTYGGSHRGMLGTGCMMIRREVFENLPYPWFQTQFYEIEGFETADGKAPFKTEDTFFCELAQEHGYHVHLDTRIKSPHYHDARCWPDEWRQFGQSSGEKAVEEIDEQAVIYARKRIVEGAKQSVKEK